MADTYSKLLGLSDSKPPSSDPEKPKQEKKSPGTPQKPGLGVNTPDNPSSSLANTQSHAPLSRNTDNKGVQYTYPVPPVRDVRPARSVLPAPLKRVMKQRWPVDIYQDQYESLQRLSLEERKQGGVGSMSAMVREALDKLIRERSQE